MTIKIKTQRVTKTLNAHFFAYFLDLAQKDTCAVQNTERIPITATRPLIPLDGLCFLPSDL